MRQLLLILSFGLQGAVMHDTSVFGQISPSPIQYNPFTQDTLFICGTDTLTLDAGSGYIAYNWSNGETTQTVQAANTGKYFVTVTDGENNSYSDTVFVSVIRYHLNGYSTIVEPFETQFDAVNSTSLMTGTICTYDCEVLEKWECGSIWTAPEDGVLDSISFEVTDFEGNDFGKDGSVTVYELLGNDACNANEERFLKAISYGINIGYQTLPLHQIIKKGKKYLFLFTKSTFDLPQVTRSLASFRVGNLPGYLFHSWFGGSCSTVANGVWIQLKGSYKTYPSPGNEYYSCHSDSILLSIQAEGNYQYAWSTGDTVPAIKVLPDSSARYSVNISNEYHNCADSALVTMFNIPFNPFATDSIFACNQTSYALDAATPGYDYYAWNTGSVLPMAVANQDGWYEVQAADSRNCTATDSVYVTVLQADVRSYRFIGDGLYSDAANWEVDGPSRPGKPPAIIGPHESIYIDPSGICIMDVLQVVRACSDFEVRPGKTIVIQGNLHLTK